MKSKRLKRSLNSFLVALGIILIWRGIWYILDWIDMTLFMNNHTYTAVFGIVAGILILYLPDNNLDELGKL